MDWYYQPSPTNGRRRLKGGRWVQDKELEVGRLEIGRCAKDESLSHIEMALLEADQSFKFSPLPTFLSESLFTGKEKHAHWLGLNKIVQIVSPLLAWSDPCFEARFIEAVASLSKFLLQPLPSFGNSFVWHLLIRWFMVYWFVLVYWFMVYWY